jgi:hypothetical protein
MSAPFDIRRARRQGTTPWRPASMIEAFQGNPYAFLQGNLAQALRVPLDPNVPEQDLPAAIANVAITWTSQTYAPSSAEQIVNAFPNRVVLVVQNLSSANSTAINFDAVALISGTLPNQVSQGILLLPGASLYIDRWCPTGTVHIAASSVSVTVTQAFSAAGNMPQNTGGALG